MASDLKGCRRPQSLSRFPAAVVAVIALSLSSCATTQDVQVHRDSSRTFAPTALVEVLQTMPSQPYVRIATLDAQAPAGTPVTQVLAQLQAKAAQLGANALVVQDLSTRQGGSLQYNPVGGQFTTMPTEIVPHLRAVAIRIED